MKHRLVLLQNSDKIIYRDLVVKEKSVQPAGVIFFFDIKHDLDLKNSGHQAINDNKANEK